MLPDLDKKFPKLRKKILKPFLIDCNPNIITGLAFLAAVVSGYLFYTNQIVLASIFVFLNGFLDILDGEIAKKYNKRTKIGDFLDHAFDRISDVAIFLGLALNPLVPDLIGFSTIIFVLLVSYLGTQFQALTKKRLYGGIFGRGDRILFLFIFGILSYFFEKSLYWGVILILILSMITFAQRFYISIKKI